MKSVSEIIYDSPDIKSYCKKVAGNDHEDVFSDLLWEVLNCPDDRFIKASNEGRLNIFCFKTIKNIHCKKKSRNRLVLEENMERFDAPSAPDRRDLLERINRDMHSRDLKTMCYSRIFYYSHIVLNSTYQLSKVAHIPHPTILNACTRYRRMIKQSL